MSDARIGIIRPVSMTSEERDAKLIGKVFRRLVGFVFVLYIFAYLDRINIGYAALSMNKDLGLTATTFGFANTLFYLTYLCFELPSNLIMVRVGARVWIARIMITWGIAATATAFVVGPNSLYIVRAFVGLAEAGFVPGMLLYLSYWFPASHRARAMAIFMTAMPVTMILGSPLSGLILGLQDTLGLAGWRWLFLIEGLPAVLLGILCFVYLADKPATAKWLDAAERENLQRLLDRDRPAVALAAVKGSVWRELTSARILLLCLVYFCLTTSLNTYATWSAQIVRDVLGAGSTFTAIGLIGAIPPIFTLIAMPLFSASADRLHEHFWHTIALFALAALGWVGIVVLGDPVWRLAGLVLVSIGAFTGMAIFWAFATAYISPACRPAAIGLVSSSGILGSVVSPSLIGFLKDLTHSFSTGLWYTTALLVLGIGAMALVRWRHPRVAA